MQITLGWFVVISLICSIINFWIGAMIKPYLGKKGENLATHEDFDRLLAEVEKTTNATKLIEARISNDLWVSQKGWELKKDILLNWLHSVYDAHQCLRKLVVTLTVLSVENIGDGWRDEIEDSLEIWRGCGSEIDKSRAELFLVAGPDLSQVIMDVDDIKLVVDDMITISRSETMSDLKVWLSKLHAAHHAFGAVVSASALLTRRELGVTTLPSIPQSSESSATQRGI